MKIGFDFDGTLQRNTVQRMAKLFIKEGHEVFIITTRNPNSRLNNEIDEVCKELGISEVIYTNAMDKYPLIPDDTDLYFDDNIVETKLINKHKPDIVAICIRSNPSSVWNL